MITVENKEDINTLITSYEKLLKNKTKDEQFNILKKDFPNLIKEEYKEEILELLK